MLNMRLRKLEKDFMTRVQKKIKVVVMKYSSDTGCCVALAHRMLLLYGRMTDFQQLLYRDDNKCLY